MNDVVADHGPSPSSDGGADRGGRRRQALARITSRLRVRFADAVRRRLLGPVAGAIPHSSIRSIEENLHLDRIARHVVAAHPWREPVVATYATPEGFGPGHRSDKAFDARRIWSLDDACVSPESGLVWLPGGPVLEESLGSLRRIIGWGDVRGELLRGVVRAADGAPLVAMPPVPYYHWLLEGLPSVVGALQVMPDARLLLHDPSPAYVTAGADWLRAAGLHTGGLVRARGPLRARALLPALDPFSGFVHPADISLLRERLLPAALRAPSASSGARAERFYISRRRATARSLAGEAALERALAVRGVNPMVLEDLDLLAQVRLFAGAAAVVAPHGAGLANLVWCAPGTRVVEIFPHGFRHDCYARLAASLDLPYACVEARASGDVDVGAVCAAIGD